MMKKCHKHRLLVITIFLPEKKHLEELLQHLIHAIHVCRDSWLSLTRILMCKSNGSKNMET